MLQVAAAEDRGQQQLAVNDAAGGNGHADKTHPPYDGGNVGTDESRRSSKRSEDEGKFANLTERGSCKESGPFVEVESAGDSEDDEGFSNEHKDAEAEDNGPLSQSSGGIHFDAK